jgi:hypothetical protein
MKAELDNIKSVSLRKDADLCITLKNPLSDYELREKIVFNPTVLIQQEENSRDDPHHFSLKWDGSKKHSTIKVLSEAEAKTALKKKSARKHLLPGDCVESGEWQPILGMECRGLEPTIYHPGDEFVITSVAGTIFTDDTDLSDSDWADYDAEHDTPVGLSQIEFKWESV